MELVRTELNDYTRIECTDPKRSFQTPWLYLEDGITRFADSGMWGVPGFFEELLKEMPYFFWGVHWREGDDLWIEKIFPVQPEEMEQYVIYAEFTDLVPEDEIENLLQYEWQVTFPGNMIQIETNK